MVRSTKSLALALAAVLAAAVSSEPPDVEEEEAAQMHVKLLQVGASSQRVTYEDREAAPADDEESDEVELAQVRLTVTKGLKKKVGIAADGGVRTRGAGVAGAFARGRAAFRVAGDGSMTAEEDEDDDVLLSKVQLLQTKTQPVRIVQHRATMSSAETVLLQEGTAETSQQAAEDDGTSEADAWDARAAIEFDVDPAGEWSANGESESHGGDGSWQDELMEERAGEDDASWDAPRDINEDSSRVALAGVQRSGADAAVEEGGSSPDAMAAADDAQAEDALMEVSEMTDVEREELYEALLGEEGPGSEQVGSEFFEAGAQAAAGDRSAYLLQTDGTAGDESREDSQDDEFVDDGSLLVSVEDGVVEDDAPAEDESLLAFEADVPEEDESVFLAGAPIKQVLALESIGEGISLSQTGGASADDFSVRAESEAEALIGAEAAMASTQLMQQDVFQFTHKAIAETSEDGADGQSLLSGILPATAGRSSVSVDQVAEFHAVEAADDGVRGERSGVVAMAVTADGLTRWED